MGRAASEVSPLGVQDQVALFFSLSSLPTISSSIELMDKVKELARSPTSAIINKTLVDSVIT